MSNHLPVEFCFSECNASSITCDIPVDNGGQIQWDKMDNESLGMYRNMVDEQLLKIRDLSAIHCESVSCANSRHHYAIERM